MAQHDRIDLAHEVDFAIGPLSIRPSTREITRGDHREIIEPRVMQVLVALARAQGAVLSKDDLIETCWESRVVGEDAVNRVLSRLRKVSEGIGKGAFHVETVTRVGYRLIAEGMPAPPEPAPGHALPDRAVLLDRRWALGMLAAAALATGSGWLTLKRKPAPPAGLSNLLDKAEAALAYNTPEQNDAAVGIMQEAARRFPERAEAWGKLAIAYRQQGLNSRRSDALDIMGRAQAAARRAVEIDGDNADGAV
ncbi:MAG: winged helix-turn-helix domain-containing protein, partial [Novosphingobium sp.]